MWSSEESVNWLLVKTSGFARHRLTSSPASRVAHRTVNKRAVHRKGSVGQFNLQVTPEPQTSSPPAPPEASSGQTESRWGSEIESDATHFQQAHI